MHERIERKPGAQASYLLVGLNPLHRYVGHVEGRVETGLGEGLLGTLAK